VEKKKKEQMMVIMGKRHSLLQGKGETTTDYLHIKKLIEMNKTIKFC